MKKAFFGIFFFSIFLIHSLFGQGEKPVIRVESFFFEGLRAEEERIIETLFQSYLSTMGTLVYSPKEEASPLSPEEEPVPLLQEPLAHDFTFSSMVALEQKDLILKITVGYPKTNESISYSASYKSTGELLLNARVIVESALVLRTALNSPAIPPAAGVRQETTARQRGSLLEGSLREGSLREGSLGEEPAPGYTGPAEEFFPPDPLSVPVHLTEQSIAGSWRGDPGIKLVRLQRGGRGIAVFSSGAQMNLVYAIEDNTLKITQNSPNTERYYHPVPYEVAKRLKTEAAPMYWQFMLYNSGSVLRGFKVATAVRYQGETVLELLHNSARDAEWTRVNF
jgi:hypothetical protein